MNPFSNGMRVEMPGKPGAELGDRGHAVAASRCGRSAATRGSASTARSCGSSRTARPWSAMRCMFGHLDRAAEDVHRGVAEVVPREDSTFGAPSGAFGGRYGSQSGAESRMSSAILPANSCVTASASDAGAIGGTAEQTTHPAASFQDGRVPQSADSTFGSRSRRALRRLVDHSIDVGGIPIWCTASGSTIVMGPWVVSPVRCQLG